MKGAEENGLDAGPYLSQFSLFHCRVWQQSSEMAVDRILVKAKQGSNIPQWKEAGVVTVWSSDAKITS
jgi:hypothetical protein